MTFRIANNHTKKLRKASEQWILDRSTFQRIKDKTGYSKMGKWKQVQKYSKYIPYPIIHYIRNKEKATGILLLDATFTKVRGEERAILIAYDSGIGVIDYWIDESENKTAYDVIFQHLDSAGYRPICVVSDGNVAILSLVVERNLPHQRCIFHLLRDLKSWLMQDGEFVYAKDHILYSRIKAIFKTGKIENLPARLELFRSILYIFSHRKSILEWFWEILPNAVLHLSYKENVPRTTNLLENLNGQIKQRIKTMRGVKSEKSLHNLLKILFYFRKYK